MRQLSDFLNSQESYFCNVDLDLISEAKMTPEDKEITEWMKTQICSDWGDGVPKNLKCFLKGSTLEVYGFKANRRSGWKTLWFEFTEDITENFGVQKLIFKEADEIHLYNGMICKNKLTIVSGHRIQLQRDRAVNNITYKNLHFELPKSDSVLEICDDNQTDTKPIKFVDVTAHLPKKGSYVWHHGVKTNPDVLAAFKNGDFDAYSFTLTISNDKDLDKDPITNPFIKHPIKIDGKICKGWEDIHNAYRTYSKDTDDVDSSRWFKTMKKIAYDWSISLGYDPKKDQSIEIECRNHGREGTGINLRKQTGGFYDDIDYNDIELYY